MKVLVLDFSETIVDTIYEGFLVSWNTYQHFFGSTKLFDGARFDYSNFEFFFKDNVFDRFKELKPYEKSAGQEVAILLAIEQNVEILNESDFKRFILTLPKEQLDGFYHQFYVERKKLQNIDLDKWNGLFKSNEKIVKSFNKYKENLFIVSNKNKEAMKILLKKIGLFVDDKKIYDTSITNDKLEKFKILMNDYKLAPNDIIYIDDKLSHLMDLKELGIRLGLATWFRKDKSVEGVIVLNEDNIEEFLEKNISKIYQ